MYSKLPLKFIGITDCFGMRKDPVSGVSTYHYGLDLGWNKYQGEPVYAASDGKVVYEGYDSNLGNYVVLKYSDGKNTIINRYLHLKNRAVVKKNQRVKRGEKLGYMGNTGYSSGVHLHFEYWVCPSSYSYKYSDRPKYARDPLQYCYLFEDQEVSSGSVSRVKRVVGTPTERNKTKNQLRVIEKGLNCRVLPSLKEKVRGYIDLGYYNILDSKISDGYIWYKIGSNKWIAYLKDMVVRYLVDKDIPNKKIEESVSNEKETTLEQFDNYNKFVAEKDDYYYIKLKKGETIYFPK